MGSTSAGSLGHAQGFEFGDHSVDHRRIVLVFFLRRENSKADVVVTNGTVEQKIFKDPAHLVHVIFILPDELERAGDAIP